MSSLRCRLRMHKYEGYKPQGFPPMFVLHRCLLCGNGRQTISPNFHFPPVPLPPLEEQPRDEEALR